MSFFYPILVIFFSINVEKITVFGFGDLQSRVLGGFNCNITDHPFMVSVISNTLCGGSLITLEWVLTAAHCILPEDLEYATLLVRTGFNSDERLIQYRNGTKTIIHEKFNDYLMERSKEIRYDIGLILVERPFEYSPVAQPAKITEIAFTKNHCHTIRAAGIGKTSNSEEFGSAEEAVRRPLKCVDLKVISKFDCAKQFHSAIVDDSLICAKDHPGKDTCVGDSGGPVLCNNVLVGITSFGPQKCGNGEAVSNTKIESYLDFIFRHVKTIPKPKNMTKISKKTTLLDIREDAEYSTSSQTTSTKKVDSGSCNLYNLSTYYLNILLAIIALNNFFYK